MGKRAIVFADLSPAQGEHISDPFHRCAAHVRGELLIAINRQTLFQAKLEPIAASDAIAGPVVEILMRDDRFDPFKV